MIRQDGAIVGEHPPSLRARRDNLRSLALRAGACPKAWRAEEWRAVLAADILMLIGTILHLVPCWKISLSFSERRMAIEIALRGVTAVVLASLIFLFSLTRYFM